VSWLSSFVTHNRALVQAIPTIGGGINAIFPDPTSKVGMANIGQYKLVKSAQSIPGQGLPIKLPQGAPSPKPGKTIPTNTDSIGVSPGGGLTILHKRQVLVPNKRPSQKITVDAQGNQVVTKKHRRINPLNVHALKRAARRLKGFHKIAVRIEKALHMPRATAHHRAAPHRFLPRER
jgi:hypothetical protein